LDFSSFGFIKTGFNICQNGTSKPALMQEDRRRNKYPRAERKAQETSKPAADLPTRLRA
jgi:hypothetical protein